MCGWESNLQAQFHTSTLGQDWHLAQSNYMDRGSFKSFHCELNAFIAAVEIVFDDRGKVCLSALNMFNTFCEDWISKGEDFGAIRVCGQRYCVKRVGSLRSDGSHSQLLTDHRVPYISPP